MPKHLHFKKIVTVYVNQVGEALFPINIKNQYFGLTFTILFIPAMGS